jgi:DNA-binding beta-propeller fold protein YncE
MRKKNLQHRSFLIAGLGVLGLASWALLGGVGHNSEIALGGPRLVSIQPMPEMDGPMCDIVPASASEELFEALMQAPAGATPRAATGDIRNAIRDRSPLRVIKDPYPTYSAVAMDFNHDEIVLLDENLFQIMAYDRTANTPANATMTEPKRVIGGHHTKIEFNCGLYIDPKNGDIYAVNNDTLDTLVIFNREAKGDVPPTRELHTPHRTYGIAVDEEAEEMFLTVQDSPHVVVYNKWASGEDDPIRILRGNKTKLADAHGISLDTKNGWMFVANYGNAADYVERPAGQQGGQGGGGGGGGFGGRVPGSGRFEPPSITVYPIKAQGDTAPIRTIQGPKTKLDWPAHIFVDDVNGDLYVANDGGHSVLVFKTTDNGDVAPYRVIAGPKSNIKNPTGVHVDHKNNELVVANMGNHMATVFPRDANGDVAPKRVIRAAPLDTPALQIGNPGAVAYDTNRDEIIVPN